MGVRPSELMNLDPDDQIAIYDFDNAIVLFGSSLQNEIESIYDSDEKKAENKRRRILAKWIPEAADSVGPQYRDPAKET